MKLLLITESLPFPPRNGRELPTSRIVNYLSQHNEVDILVLNNSKEDFDERKSLVPTSIKNVFFLKIVKYSTFKAAINEMLLKDPVFFGYDFLQEEYHALPLKDKYDIVWCSPVGIYHFVKTIGANNLGTKIGIGLNDVKYYLYLDSWKELKSGRFGLDPGRVMYSLRLLFIKYFEKRYLNEIDFVHVQNEVEKKKIHNLIGKGGSLKIIANPNAIQEELFNNDFDEASINILLLTQFDGGRKLESKWFVTEVWPQIRIEYPHLKLQIIGKPPSKKSWIYDTNLTNVNINGFVNNYSDAFKNVFCMVVPILHSTGTINRVLDGLAAAIPVIGSTQALSTIKDLENNVHALCADNTKHYLEAFEKITNTNELLSLSEKGRELARSKMTWVETAESIESELKELIN